MIKCFFIATEGLLCSRPSPNLPTLLAAGKRQAGGDYIAQVHQVLLKKKRGRYLQRSFQQGEQRNEWSV